MTQKVESHPELARDEYSKGITNIDNDAYSKYMQGATARKERNITLRNNTEEIKQSKAAFVLLGPNVELTIYTRNWISFEIGLAAALGKPIWVFEPIQSNIKFPIPYLNHYMQYELEYDREYITSIVKAYEKSKVEPPDGFIVKCSYDNCKLPFILHTKTYSFNCPACRQPLQINSLDSPTKKYYYQDPITGLDERMGKRII